MRCVLNLRSSTAMPPPRKLRRARSAAPRMERGQRYAACDKTYQLYKKEPYREHFAFVDPREKIPPDQARPFDCRGTRLRHPKETKGHAYNATTEAGQCCDGGNGVCC